MTETKCTLHQAKLDEIEGRLSRIEDDLDSVISEQHRNATTSALATQAIELFRDAMQRLEVRIEALSADRGKIIAGLLANGAIGVTMLGVLLWVLERAVDHP